MAVAADDEAPQRKIDIQIGALGRIGNALPPLLNALVGLEADQRLMLAGPQGHIPARRLDVAGIDALLQQDVDALVADDAGAVLGEQRIVLKEAHHLGLGLEAAGRVAFERFLYDRGNRLVALQHHAATGYPLVFVAGGGLKDPIAVQDPRAHAVHGLLAVLLALVLRDAGEQVFDEQGIRVLAEFDGGGFENAAGAGDRAAQLQMRLQAARKTGHVIDDDHHACGATLADKSEHRFHPGAVDQAARHVVLKHVDDRVILPRRVIPAACFLRPQPVAVFGLFDAGDAAINYRLFLCVLAHNSSFFNSPL